VVDKRELKSKLPAYLYYSGFKICAMFLEVGDYILNDNLVIERKSVASGDLMQSLKSNRLNE
jgi:ERCC4-type nuclease